MSRALLRLGSRFLPYYRQCEWLDEWEGELWALECEGAGRLALVRFALAGVAESVWERHREEGLMGGLAQDVRHACRRLVRAPLFSIVVVLVLALGIGANASLFSALNAALLARPPYPDVERLVTVDLLLAPPADAPVDTMPWSYPKYATVTDGLDVVEPFAAYSTRTHTLTGQGRATRIGVEYVTPSYFPLLAVRPALGRVFDAGDEYPAAGTAVVLGHRLWTTRFGADASAIGRTIRLDGATLEIVGVAPPRFRGLTGGADVFVPVAAAATLSGPRRLTRAGSHWLRAIGRLDDGVTLEQANAQAAALGAAVTAAYPDALPAGAAHDVTLVPFLRARVNPVARLAVGVVSAAALVLLLIACANVAGLLVARSLARRADVAVRAALGAGRGRLMREFLIEGLIVATIAGALGVLLAYGGAHVVAEAVRYALDTAGTRGLQFLDPDSFGVDGRVLTAGIGLALLAGMFFGWLPARVSTRRDLGADLRGGRGPLGEARVTAGGASRGLLVAGQLALTVVLLAGAGLMAASFARLSSIDVGFRNDDVLMLRYERARAPGQERVLEAQLLERVRALPGVVDAAIAPCAPLSGICELYGIRRIDGQPPSESGDRGSILGYAVSDAYFATLGIDLHAGRGFARTDDAGTPPVAIVNEAAAREHFGGDAIGRRISVTHELTPAESGVMAEIIGVASDVRYDDLEAPAFPAVYFSRRQALSSYGTLLVRTTGDPLARVSDVRRESAALDPEMPLYDITTLADLRAAATARTRIVLGLLAAFALAGLLLSAIGLYGIVSYTVVQRTRELGLRMALGAVAADVMRLVVAPPLRLAVGGAVLGFVGALLLTRFVAALLYETEAADPRILAAATLTLITVAVLAAWSPARRATRVDPAITLRSE